MMLWSLILSSVFTAPKLEHFILAGGPDSQSSLRAACGPRKCLFQPIPPLSSVLPEALTHPHSTLCLVGGQEA